jgi:type IV pilus assembly protein PilB
MLWIEMNPPKIENPKFFELLKKKQLIPDEFIHDLLKELDGNALDVLATLIQSRIGTKRQLCQLWCDSIGIAHVDLEKSLFQPDVVRKIPERLARQVYAIPVYQMGDTITVATATPDNDNVKKEIQQVVGAPVNLVFALPQDIEWAIENEYQTNAALYEFFSKIKASQVCKQDIFVNEKKLFEMAGRDAINQFHVSLILFGVIENASEIHIEPVDNFAKVYHVTRESLKERITLDKPVYQKLALKLKQLAKMDAIKDNQSHYSRIIFPTPGKKIDIQFLCLPTDYGDKIFLKLMDRHPIQRAPALKELCLSLSNMRQIRNGFKSKKGMILISGPPQSGKSTLAYAILRELRSEKIGILTVEDSIKRLLKDIDQFQINPRAGFNRSDALESCIKLLPKVIYIQNMDDPDIAEIVRREAEHRNIFFIGGMESENALEALEKSSRLGLHQIVSVIINAQCIRRLCDHCKEPYNLSSSEIEKLFVWDQASEVTVFREKGCPYCRQTGFFDRIGVQEVLSVDENLLRLISSKAPMKHMVQTAAQLGFKSKEYDGIKKVLRGLTTFKEILGKEI